MSVTVIAWIPDRMVGPMSYTPAFHLCADLHPRVAESSDRVLVELVDESVERGGEWSRCQHARDGSTGTIELTEPLDDRTLVDAVSGEAVPVIDGDHLMFPTALPAPFDAERWREATSDDGSWTFSWTAGPRRLPAGAVAGPILELRITRWDLDAERPTRCAEEPVELRGVTGNLCDSDAASRLLTWAENGGFFALEVLDIVGEPLPEGIDLVAIAQGLEPLGG